MTTMPRIETVLIISRIRSTAAWSAAFFSPRPTQRAAPIAAASVTRTSSSARFRSGAPRALTTLDPARGLAASHPLWGVHADELEALRDDSLCRGAEAEPERLLLG